MNNTIDKIIADIQSVKSEGTEFIDTGKLLNYLDDLKGNEIQSHDENLEKLKSSNLLQIEKMKLIAAVDLESFRSVIAIGMNASKSCMIVNGGAAVALLAFIGNIWNKDSSSEAVTQVAFGILYFSIGVLLAALCTGFTYISQYAYSKFDIDDPLTSKYQIIGITFNATALLVGICSLALFGLGCYSAFDAITTQFKAA